MSSSNTNISTFDIVKIATITGFTAAVTYKVLNLVTNAATGKSGGGLACASPSKNVTGGRGRSGSFQQMFPLGRDEQYDGFSDDEEELVQADNVAAERNAQAAPSNVDLSVGRKKISTTAINLYLSRLMVHLKERTHYHLGYPYNLSFKSEGLMPFMKFSINNLGDPFVTSNYGVHSRNFEIAVLDFFANLWEIKRGNYWGYITTCGTEGNLLGVLYGREKFAPNRNAVLYCSKETHYSVPKAARMYQMDIELIETDESGEMIYSDLKEKLQLHLGRPAVVNINVGTTVRGAYDTIDEVVGVLQELDIPREMYYIHCDGALNGMILPFLSSKTEPKRISFDKPIDSVSVSGHKMLGCPMPCGIVITRKEHMSRWAQDVEYLNSTDTTIMGSRNGQAALAMWVALQRKGMDGLRADVVQCIDNALYLKELFDNDGVKCSLNEFSVTVVFERPCRKIVQKWQLACTGDIAHVVVMPSVSKSKLRRFHQEVVAAKEFSRQELKE